MLVGEFSVQPGSLNTSWTSESVLTILAQQSRAVKVLLAGSAGRGKSSSGLTSGDFSRSLRRTLIRRRETPRVGNITSLGTSFDDIGKPAGDGILYAFSLSATELSEKIWKTVSDPQTDFANIFRRLRRLIRRHERQQTSSECCTGTTTETARSSLDGGGREPRDPPPETEDDLRHGYPKGFKPVDRLAQAVVETPVLA